MNKAYNPRAHSLNNREVAERYGHTDISEGTGSNLFIEGRAVYSYGHHFPIAVKTDAKYNGRPIILWNSDGYSMTTAKHKSYIGGELGDYMRIEASTEALQSYINVIEYLGDMRGTLSDIDKELDARHDRYEEKRQRARTEASRQSWEHQRAEVVEMMQALEELVRHHISQPIQDISDLPL